MVKDNNISAFKSAVQLSAGLVTGNYIHDPGYIAGDHTNGVIANGGTGRVTIIHNTILNDLSQTDAITLDTMTVRGPVANKTIEGNLLGGGSYPIYGGSAFGHHTFNIAIKDNQFSRIYYPESGCFGHRLSRPPNRATSGRVTPGTSAVGSIASSFFITALDHADGTIAAI